MRRTLIRVASVVGVVALAAVVSSAALAVHGHGKFGGRLGIRAGGFGPGMMGGGNGPFFVQGGGPGFFGPGMGQGKIGVEVMGGPGFGGPGMGEGMRDGPGGGGLLGADILNPSATFLGIPLATLQSDLAGGKTLAQEAVAKGKTAADLITYLTAAEKTILDADKAAGWLTADQETAALAQLNAAITDLVNNGPPVPPTGEKAPQGPLQIASTYLGIPVSDLLTALQSGKSLADEVATVPGKTVDGLVQALLAPAKAKLDQAVTDQQITQAQENAILAHMTTALTDFVNHKPGTSSSATTTTNTTKKNLIRLMTLKHFGKRH